MSCLQEGRSSRVCFLHKNRAALCVCVRVGLCHRVHPPQTAGVRSSKGAWRTQSTQFISREYLNLNNFTNSIRINAGKAGEPTIYLAKCFPTSYSLEVVSFQASSILCSPLSSPGKDAASSPRSGTELRHFWLPLCCQSHWGHPKPQPVSSSV